MKKKSKKKKKPPTPTAAGLSEAGQGVAESAEVAAQVDAAPVTVAGAVAKGAAAAKRKRCATCQIDSHSTKECSIDRYCYFCDRVVHLTLRCPILKVPKPYGAMAGIGYEDTMFSHLPDGVFRPQLATSTTPVAVVTVTGEPVSAEVVQSMIARYCPLQSAWRWEAIPHGQYKEDSFLVNFPSMADLERMKGSELGVPKQKSVITIDIWKPTDVEPMAELTPT